MLRAATELCWLKEENEVLSCVTHVEQVMETGCLFARVAAHNSGKQRVNTTFDCNITPLLDASEMKEIDLIYSVRIRPQGPDYLRYVARLTSGEWTCSYGDCQIAEQGRCRSETGKHCTYIYVRQ